MPLERLHFDVYLDDPDNPDGYVEHRVEIRGADQLRAELEGKRMGVTIKDSMHQTYLWAWAACRRLDLLDLSFKDFRDVVISVEGDKDDEPDLVDPTQPAAIAGSPSPSPPPTPATPTNGG